jgi:asparagine synthase (glutamine-hydrolysing)
MCGIAGFVSSAVTDSAAGQKLTARMLDQIVHRGPDDRGMLQVPSVGFFGGMQRLSIIDLSTGHQPVWNEDQTVAVLFNGEIYNYVELRSELISKGHVFHTGSDTEVLVHLYEEMGTAMPDRLRGMFGFAILDLKKNRCLIARDHFGQKPMYWWAAGQRLAFASEIKSLLVLPFVPCKSDPEAFLDYVSWLRLPAPQTHFKDIFRLGPGELLDIDLAQPSAAKPTVWWKFQFAERPQFVSMSEASAALEQALDESVRLHLRSDVPIGVMLSGGLDSRVIGGFAKQHVQTPLQTFSVEFDGEDSEGPAALESARWLGSQHHAVKVKAEDLGQTIREVAWHLDEPVADPAAFAVLKLCRMAREHVKVLLGGEGADELFAGYAGRYQSMMSQVSRSRFLRAFSFLIPKADLTAQASRVMRARYRAGRAMNAELVECRIEGLPGGSLAQWGLTAAQLKRLSVRSQQYATQLVPETGSIMDRMQVLDMRWQLAESLLLKSDKMSMAASLELRCPFLDSGVAAVASQIPARLRMGATGPGKLVLRDVAQRRFGVGSQIPKKGFPIPLGDWLRGPLREQCEATILGTGSPLGSLLEANRLKKLWAEFQSGAPLEVSLYSLWLYCEWASGTDSRKLR